MNQPSAKLGTSSHCVNTRPVHPGGPPSFRRGGGHTASAGL